MLLLLFLLAVLRLSAWLATLIGSVVTFLLGLWVWKMPLDDGVRAYLYGSATGVWNVDWITFWGVMLFNTLVTTGVFEKFRRWLVAAGNAAMCGCKPFCSPGPSAPCSRDWSASVIPGRSSRRF